MARVAVLLTTAAVLAGWAGAQGPPPPLAPADRVALFRANRSLVGNLVTDGLALSDAGSPLGRAEGSRVAARTLANHLGRAAEGRDPDRVAELADLFGVVVRDGLAPTLSEAADTIPPESPEAEQLRELRRKALRDLDEVGAVPAVADHPKVRAALDRLADLRAKIVK